MAIEQAFYLFLQVALNVKMRGALVEFFFADAPVGLSFESDCRFYCFFGFALDRSSFDGFSANAYWQEPSFGACGVLTVGDFAVILGPSAPHGVSTVD